MSKQTDQIILNLWARKLMDEAKTASVFEQWIPARKPLTRVERVRGWLSMWSDRFGRAWAALRGIDNDY